MPICKNSAAAMASKKLATDISADHETEAAQVKRTREQAYFNSYDFDAIEVLPYDEDDDDEEVAAKATSVAKRESETIAHDSQGSSSGSCSRSSANSARYLEPRHNIAHVSNKFAYLQRIGAFFGRPPIGSSYSSNSNHSHQSSVDGVAHSNGDVMCNVGAVVHHHTNENFLLPRAILKYQSSSSNSNSSNNIITTGGHTTSMPLTVPADGEQHQYQHQHHHHQQQQHQQQQQQQQQMSNVAKTRLDGPHGHDSQTGLQNEIKPVDGSRSNSDGDGGAMAAAASPSRNKKRSIALSSSSTSSHTADSGLSHGHDAINDTTETKLHNKPIAINATRVSSATIPLPTMATTRTAATPMQSRAAVVGRHGSHQSSSHYSTDKSGSSGYYSSNVCSTYSLDEHIYSEPVIDTLRPQLPIPQPPGVGGGNVVASKVMASGVNMERKMEIETEHDGDDGDDDDEDRDGDSEGQKRLSSHYSEKLRVLETSIENLDRHLKSFPSLYSQEQIVNFVQSIEAGERQQQQLHPHHQLPTIVEGCDDSLLDIDLDAFLLANERRQNSPLGGHSNPSFLTDERLKENNYKCAKYINSCPENAYRVEESDIVGVGGKRYEEQIHFQSTRELLEDVRDKIRLLSRSRNDERKHQECNTPQQDIPKELDGMIETLKQELESYLQRMNQHSELELRQLCSGLGRSQHVMKLQNAFERRRSSFSAGNAYEALTTRQFTSIRCLSDPNFKMKRKSLADIFPMGANELCIESEMIAATTTTLYRDATPTTTPTPPPLLNHMMAPLPPLDALAVTQLQRNLTFHKPVLTRKTVDDAQDNRMQDNVAEWHRKKPSIWQMYYGTNRLHQSLLGKQRPGELVVSSAQPTLSYPSSRPESDFTLDLPRAEQLRLKMEKEKKFRQRCRFITTFLSLVFFLLTVIVVSMVSTRGKRMFGSMI